MHCESGTHTSLRILAADGRCLRIGVVALWPQFTGTVCADVCELNEAFRIRDLGCRE